MVSICALTSKGGTVPSSSCASLVAVLNRLSSVVSALPPGSPHVWSLFLLLRFSSKTLPLQLQDASSEKNLISTLYTLCGLCGAVVDGANSRRPNTNLMLLLPCARVLFGLFRLGPCVTATLDQTHTLHTIITGRHQSSRALQHLG